MELPRDIAEKLGIDLRELLRFNNTRLYNGGMKGSSRLAKGTTVLYGECCCSCGTHGLSSNMNGPDRLELWLNQATGPRPRWSRARSGPPTTSSGPSSTWTAPAMWSGCWRQVGNTALKEMTQPCPLHLAMDISLTSLWSGCCLATEIRAARWEARVADELWQVQRGVDDHVGARIRRTYPVDGLDYSVNGTVVGWLPQGEDPEDFEVRPTHFSSTAATAFPCPATALRRRLSPPFLVLPLPVHRLKKRCLSLPPQQMFHVMHDDGDDEDLDRQDIQLGVTPHWRDGHPCPPYPRHLFGWADVLRAGPCSTRLKR